MNKKELEAFAKQAAKGIKTEADLNDFRAMLTKVTVEAALNAELDHHLGYQINEKVAAGNNRNGYSHKQIKTEDVCFELTLPVTEMVALSLRWLKRTKPASPRWMTKFYIFKRKG